MKDDALSSISFLAEGFENSSRKVRIIKLTKGYAIFRELIIHYADRTNPDQSEIRTF